MKITLPHHTLIGHRGACAFYPENTLESFHGAAQLGAHWVETDVMLTKDKIPVLFHDDTLERITGEGQLIGEMDYAEVKQVDAGSWFDSRFAGAVIPTLAEALDAINDLHLSLNLELKPTLGENKATATEAIRVLREKHFPQTRLIISSFSLPTLEAAYTLAPEYAYGWLADALPDLYLGLDSQIPWNSIHLNLDFTTPELITELHDQGFQVLVYTVNDPKRARFLFDHGVSAVFADDPTPL